MDTSNEEFQVTLDFQKATPDFSLPYKLIGLETDHPIIKVGSQVFRGTWATVIGTEMIFDDEGEWVMNVQRRLVMDLVKVIKKTGKTDQPVKTRLIRLEDMQEGAIAPISVLEPDSPGNTARDPAQPQAQNLSVAEGSEMELG